MDTNFYLVVLIVTLAILIAVAAIVIPVSINNFRYRKFVRSHSKAYKQLEEINKKYGFKTIPNYDMQHSYDNENFYGDISCEDYLTYQLVFLQKKVSQSIKDVNYNKDLLNEYEKKI